MAGTAKTGAAWLDVHKPDWLDQVMPYLDQLDQTSFFDDVWGHILRIPFTFLAVCGAGLAPEEVWTWLINYGFFAPTEAWLREIGDRMLDDNEAGTSAPASLQPVT